MNFNADKTQTAEIAANRLCVDRLVRRTHRKSDEVHKKIERQLWKIFGISSNGN